MHMWHYINNIFGKDNTARLSMLPSYIPVPMPTINYIFTMCLMEMLFLMGQVIELFIEQKWILTGHDKSKFARTIGVIRAYIYFVEKL
jgi:hypothetical protein